MPTGIIGLSGNARSGKDLLCELLSKQTKVVRLALADELKSDLKEFLISNFGIDPTNCSPSEKELVRPILVAYGAVKRKQTTGTYWTSKLTEKALEYSSDSLVVITDIRYAEYDQDELFWLKEVLGGHLTFIKKRFADGTYNPPANSDEEVNNKKLFKKADYIIEWPDGLGSQCSLDSYASDLLRWYESVKTRT